VVVAVATGAVVGLVILGLFVLLVLFAGVRLIWGLFRGDLQIEPSSWGRQYSRRPDEHLDDESD
jgi:hypothetical protein